MRFLAKLSAIVLFFCLFGLSVTHTVWAQEPESDPGSFLCRCDGITSNCFQSENWSLTQSDDGLPPCNTGFMPDQSICLDAWQSGTAQVSNGILGIYSVQCIPEPETPAVRDVAWGGTCTQENQKGECSDSSNTCRRGADNFLRCLKDIQSVSLTQGCRDISECSDRGEDIRCRNNACSEEGGRTCTDEVYCSQNNIPGKKICTGTYDSRGSCNIDAATCGPCNLVATNPMIHDNDNDTLLSDFEFCQQISDEDILQACNTCYQKGENNKANMVFTAVGCINVSDDKSLAADIIKLLFGISGGIALLSLLAAAFLLTTSQADTGKIKEAKDLATASVSGILFIIFSVVALSFIGVDILRIPGLG